MNSVSIFNQVSLNSRSDFSLIEQFLASHDIAQKSKETYKRALTQFLDYTQKNSIAQHTKLTLLGYKNDLIKRQLSAHTVSTYIIAVRKLYQWAESENMGPNIASNLKGQKKPSGFKKDALSVDQARHLLASFDTATMSGARDYALVNLLVRTGIRTIEAVRANLEDVRHQGGQTVLYIQGKGRDSKDALVVLTSATLEPLRHYLAMRGKGVRDSSPLFASHSVRNFGQRMTTRSVSRIAKNSLIFSGINDKRVTAHSLRHTAVTLSLLGGASIQEAKTLARHSDINTTLIYAHNLDRISNAPEAKIDAILSGVA